VLDYAIVVPSRARSHNMPTIRSILPTAVVCVDEREAEEYGKEVPAAQLLLHPPMGGYANVVNWIMDAVKAPILIIVDDDCTGVRVRTGSFRFITDPEEILAILENAATACSELGLSTFAFSRTMNRAMVKPEEIPIRPVSYLSNVFGIMGTARHRKMDPKFAGRNAIDLTLRTLLEDRCIYGECRFYFECGPVFSGRGGNVGLVTNHQWVKSTRNLVETWGRCVQTKPLPFRKNFTVDSMRLAVSRTNARAQK